MPEATLRGALRNRGIETRVEHERYVEGRRYPLPGQRIYNGMKLLPNGGVTHVMIWVSPDGDPYYGRATARCNKSDAFDRHIGEALAIQRALEDLEEKLLNALVVLQEVKR